MPEWVTQSVGSYRIKAPDPGPGVEWSNHNAVSERIGAAVSAAIRWALNLAPHDVWKNQPYVRIVLPFVARNVAQVGVHLFERVSDTNRKRITGTPLSNLLTLKPNGRTTAYELWYGTQLDRMLYDRAYWAVGTSRSTGEPMLARIPARRIVEAEGPDITESPDFYIMLTGKGERLPVPGRNVLEFPGYDPVDVDGIPSSPLEALKAVIAEQAAAFAFRQQTWQNGGQVSGTITRPVDAPDWGPQAKDRFLADVRSQFAGKGPQRGGVILLEEGMTYAGQQFNAREAGWIEAAKLSLALVASMYHVNPTMVGLMDNANYSNVKQFHQMLYQDTLGPEFASLEQRVNAFLLPRFAGTEKLYVEFNVQEKLEGSFEEQAQAMQTAVGAPWLTRAEARARMNLPQLPSDSGANELVTPLNVLVGGQASPTDSGAAPDPTVQPEVDTGESARQIGPGRSGKAVVLQLKAEPAAAVVQRATDIVSAFFSRMGRVVQSRGDDFTYDVARWHRELKSVILQVNILASSTAGKATLDRLGIDPGDWDEPRTLAWLTANADGVSDAINLTVKAKIEHAYEIDAEHDPDGELDHPGVSSTLLTLAGSYAALTAASQSTAMTAWGTIEASNQQGLVATKTWEAGSNPRSAHASLNGETVPVGETFSNGARWPGDSSLSDDQRAGCNCSLTINVER